MLITPNFNIITYNLYNACYSEENKSVLLHTVYVLVNCMFMQVYVN